MKSDNLEQRLSSIQTLWTLVRRAHHGSPEGVREAQEQLLKRYGGAVQRYLRGMLRNADGAEDLFQEFACRLVKGDLHGADRERGRFRQFVKGVLFHLVADYHRRQKRQPGQLSSSYEPVFEPGTLAQMDTDFVRSWREEVLSRAWKRLEECDQQSGKQYYRVLRFRAENPELSSAAMAEELSRKLDKPLSAAGVRQTLHRAREEFADLVIDEVVHSLASPTRSQLEDELTELGLIDYCRPALERKRLK